MFVDYYAILEIDEHATLEEVKIAFRKQAIKWHPDRNVGKDTTKEMQLINEAYLILKDKEARNRYNTEYQQFKSFRKEKYPPKQEPQQKTKKTYTKPKFEYAEYGIKDDLLKKWMENAKRQAIDLAKQTIKDFSGMVAIGFKEGAKASGQMLLFQIGIGVLILLFLSLYKSCNL